MFFLSGPVGKDGNECPISCPMKCDDSSEMYCDGGLDDNDCHYGDFCIPAKGGISQKLIFNPPNHNVYFWDNRWW